MLAILSNILSEDNNNIFICTKSGENSVLLNPSIVINEYEWYTERNLVFKLYKYLFGYFYLKRLISKNQIDIIVNHHRYFSPLLYLISRIGRIKTIFYAHANFSKIPLLKGSLLGDKVIAVSDGVRNDLITKFAVHPDSISVIYNGIDEMLKYDSDSIESIKNKLGINGKKIACCIGHFRKIKRQGFLIRAWSDVVKKDDSCHLLLLGYGETKDELDLLIKHNKMHKNISIVNSEFTSEEILNISDIVIMPSEREGLPLVILEGLSLNKPIIASNIPGINEVVEHNQDGLLFELNNMSELTEHIVKLLVKKENYDQFAVNARLKFDEKFCLDIYESKIKKYFVVFN